MVSGSHLFNGPAPYAVLAVLNDHAFTDEAAGILAHGCASHRISAGCLAVLVGVQRTDFPLEYAGACCIRSAAIAFLMRAQRRQSRRHCRELGIHTDRIADFGELNHTVNLAG